MKTKLLPCLFIHLCSTLFGAGEVLVQAPVTISATVQQTGDLVERGNKLSVAAPVVARVGNKEILEECVRMNLISETTGWKIMCYYDARMAGVTTYGTPTLVLRNRDGRSAEIYPVLDLELLSSVASGQSTIGRNDSVSGTLNRRGFFRLRFRYEGSEGECSGVIPLALRVSGNTTTYVGVAGAVNKAALNGTLGYINYGGVRQTLYPDYLVSMQLSAGAFTRIP